MNNSKPPSLAVRLYSVWFRHMLVYTRNLISNGLPPFLEPLIFLAGVGIGLGSYIKFMDGMPYLQFLASGLMMTSAMYTAAFECSYGTFIRLEFDKVYDGMLAAPITVDDLLIGENFVGWHQRWFLCFSSAEHDLAVWDYSTFYQRLFAVHRLSDGRDVWRGLIADHVVCQAVLPTFHGGDGLFGHQTLAAADDSMQMIQ